MSGYCPSEDVELFDVICPNFGPHVRGTLSTSFPGSQFQRLREAEKRDPENEVGTLVGNCIIVCTEAIFEYSYVFRFP